LDKFVIVEGEHVCRFTGNSIINLCDRRAIGYSGERLKDYSIEGQMQLVNYSRPGIGSEIRQELRLLVSLLCVVSEEGWDQAA